MSDDAEDAALQREIRAGRTFSMAEAIGRLNGPGGMKGASPVSRVVEARAAVDALVRRHVSDPGGVLAGVLCREIGEGDCLLASLDDPAAALAAHLRRLLASPGQLAEFVRVVDMAWGEVVGERPHFERDGAAPHPDDPYTIASVRGQLQGLLERLGA